MKSLIKLSLIGLLISFSTEKASATDISMSGIWRYSIETNRVYKPVGATQNGEWNNLGSGYYRYGYIKGGDINNDDETYDSGTLSLNFMRLNYYGGSTGTLMFTRGFRPLSVDYYYHNVYKAGYFKSSGKKGYASAYVTEYSNDGTWDLVDEINYKDYQSF